MKRRAFTPEQIIGKLREAEVLLGQGQTVGFVSRKLEVTAQPKAATKDSPQRAQRARRKQELRENS